MVRKLIPLLLLFVLCKLAHSQTTDLQIILSSGSQTFKIKAKHCNYIRLELDQRGDSLKIFRRSIISEVISISPKSFTIVPRNEKIEKTYNDCLTFRSEIFYPLNFNPTTISKDIIEQISFQNKSSNRCLNAGCILTCLGIFSTVVLAPLLSINYKTGEINSQRYFHLAGTGIALGVISIPLFICSKEKSFRISQSKDKNERIWKIEN